MLRDFGIVTFLDSITPRIQSPKIGLYHTCTSHLGYSTNMDKYWKYKWINSHAISLTQQHDQMISPKGVSPCMYLLENEQLSAGKIKQKTPGVGWSFCGQQHDQIQTTENKWHEKCISAVYNSIYVCFFSTHQNIDYLFRRVRVLPTKQILWWRQQKT